ncbi:FecR family protein [Pseudoalteromonas rhizosphaerae]|uniref:FecR family protein n=1 Tax=Pseudoalteromonas rhizosphaerae TaxID=2518973 RepID=UPI00384F9CA1
MTDRIAIFEQAANWAELSNSLSDEQQQQLATWLDEAPEHRDAYQKCLKIWHSDELENMLEEQAEQLPVSSKKPMTKWLWASAFCSVFLLIAVNFLAIQSPAKPESIIAKTNTSQSRYVDLPDGSAMKVGPQSTLSYLFTKQSRKVELSQGESLFSVQHLSDNQPFIVDAGDTRVTVTGTEFSVDKSDFGTQVIVVHGSVHVANQLDNTSVELTAGQSVEIIDGKMGEVKLLPKSFNHYLDLDNIQPQWLDAYQMSLGSVLAKLDRQMSEQISLEDNALKSMLVTGRFDLNTPKQTLQMLALANKLRVSQYSEQIIIRNN